MEWQSPVLSKCLLCALIDQELTFKPQAAKAVAVGIQLIQVVCHLASTTKGIPQMYVPILHIGGLAPHAIRSKHIYQALQRSQKI
jgi:hypothetical protein